jgi:hypothetical protein
MEFLGLTTEDFDFFRKKDKMSKQEYEKSRNEVKHHFRGLCYELQKIYHKRTAGVLNINKEYPNFNKRSINISADYGEQISNIKKTIEMNTENVSIRLNLEAHDEEMSKFIIDALKTKKSAIWDYIIADKHNQISCSFKLKGNKFDTIKYNSLDMNAKNYDSFLSFVEDNVNSGKYEFNISILHTCPKNEAIKQSKNLSTIIYEDMVCTSNLCSKLA